MTATTAPTASTGPATPRPGRPRRRAPGRGLATGLLAVWFAAPLLPLLVWTLAERWAPGTALPQAWGPSRALAALDGAALAAAGRSLLLGVVVAVLATGAGAVTARALVQGRVRFPRTVSALLLAPVALPPFAVVMGLDTVLLRLRVPGAVGVALVLTVVALPYTTYLMRVAYGAYSFAFEDEARTLGASARTVRWRVRLPLVAPGVAAAAFLAFLVGWSDYIVTLLVGGGRLVTLPVLVASAASGTGGEPVVAALSVTALLPPALALGAVVVLRRRLPPARSRGGRPRPTPRPPVPRGAA